MFWINFLHIYQPANIDGKIIKEATEKSYLHLVKILEENPHIKFTFNISGCLFLRWEELGYMDLIKRIKVLVDNKQIELTGSAAYHPLLPLIPKKEIETQIDENEKILKKYFGENFKPIGFFIPEMAYHKDVSKIIKKKGYQWLILDEIAYNGKLNNVDFDKFYIDQYSGLKIIFRSREYSKSYVPDTLIKKIEKKNRENLIITATDGELYGLRHVDYSGNFEKLLKNKDLKTLLISEFLKKEKQEEKIKPVSCNWESLEEELEKNNPYILWFDKKNKIHMEMWNFANLAYKTIEKNKKDKNYNMARWHLVRGLASCAFWWASARDFRLFDSISWSPDEIEKGINELIRSIRTIDNVKSRKIKIKAEKLYIKIKKNIWIKHWECYWKKI